MKDSNVSNPRILVIDDNESIHADFRAILDSGIKSNIDLNQEKSILFDEEEKESNQLHPTYTVDYALQGQEGVDKVRLAQDEGAPYALAFVDIRMPPGIDGIETIKKIWQICPAMEIVICSAYSDYSWHDMIKELGHTDKLLILKKPFDNIEVQQLAMSLTIKWELMNRLDQMVQQRTQEIYQWLRQTECLNRISTLLDRFDIDWPTTLPVVAELITPALQSPERAQIKLTLNGQHYCQDDEQDIDWQYRHDIDSESSAVGSLEVGFKTEPHETAPIALHPDEIELLQKITRKISHAWQCNQIRHDLSDPIPILEPTP